MNLQEANTNDLSVISVDILLPPSPFGGVQILGVTEMPIQVTFLAGGAVQSVFGRTGAVVAQCSDYATCYAPLGGGGEGPSGPVIGPEYHPEIVSLLVADGSPALEELPSAGRGYKTLFVIVIDVEGTKERQEWIIDTGAADPDDGGQVAPADYNATTNNVHFAKVG